MVEFSSRADWLKWRQTGCGSSDAPIIMGVSDFMTALKLYDKKLEAFPTDSGSNYVTDKGNEAEPKIRALVELQKMESFTACNLISEKFSWILCSLDGRSKDKKRNLEIKLINREDWEAARDGVKNQVPHNSVCPKQYWPQVQHQLMASGAELCYLALYLYSSYKENPRQLSLENLVILTIYPDKDYQVKLFTEEQKFWDCVTKRKPPVAGDQDYVPLKDMAAWVKKWKAAKAKKDKAETELEEAREKLIEAAEAANHPRLVCAGLRLTQSSKIGNVDYSKIPELAKVDLDKYRKNGSTSWTIAPITKGK